MYTGRTLIEGKSYFRMAGLAFLKESNKKVFLVSKTY